MRAAGTRPTSPISSIGPGGSSQAFWPGERRCSVRIRQHTLPRPLRRSPSTGGDPRLAGVAVDSAGESSKQRCRIGRSCHCVDQVP
jgi:hypothetical protein